MLLDGHVLRAAFQVLPLTCFSSGRADTGRTFLDGEDSSVWHSQFMAGAFYAAFDRQLLVEIGAGWSDERTVFTFEVDFDWLIR